MLMVQERVSDMYSEELKIYDSLYKISIYVEGGMIPPIFPKVNDDLLGFCGV